MIHCCSHDQRTTRPLSRVRAAWYIFPAVSLVLLTALYAACLPASASPVSGSNDDGVMHLKFSSQGNLSTDVVADFVTSYARDLEGKSNGRLKITTYFGETLGKVDEEVRMLKVGISDIAFVNAGIYADDLPLSTVAELPFIVPTDRSLPFLNLIFSKYLVKDWTGLHVLFPVWIEGLELFTTRNPIETVDDLENMDIRIPRSRTLIPVMKALGARPVNIPPSETYNALKKGLVTGELSGFSQVLTLKKYSISKYCTMMSYNCGLGAIAMNESKWNMLTPDIKKILEDASSYEQARFDDMFNEYIRNALTIFVESGVVVTSLSADEKTRFYQLTKPISDKIVKDIDDRGLPATALVNEMLKYRNSH